MSEIKRIKQNKNNLLGSNEINLLKDLLEGRNATLYSLPGMGLNTITREIVKSYLSSKPSYKVIQVYPYETYMVNIKSIEDLLLEKCKYNNLDIGSANNSINDVIKGLERHNTRALFVLNKISQFNNIPAVLTYFNSLYKSHEGLLNILITSNIKVRNNENFGMRFKLNSYTFSGFKSNEYRTLFKSMLDQFDYDKGLIKHKELLYEYTLGHAGLLKSSLRVLTTLKGDLKQFNINTLLNDRDIRLRLREVFESFESAGFALSEFKDKSCSDIIKKLGLCYKGQPGLLYKSYYESYLLDDDSILSELTSTESTLYKILKNNRDSYISVDQLIDILNDTKFNTQSNWALYKHVNNLKKKLDSFGLDIESKRGKGYKLVSKDS